MKEDIVDVAGRGAGIPGAHQPHGRVAHRHDPRLGRLQPDGRGALPDAIAGALGGQQRLQMTATLRLGMALLEGVGVEADPQEAYRGVRKAGEAGYANAEISTAVMLALGQGVEENDAEARSWAAYLWSLGVQAVEHSGWFSVLLAVLGAVLLVSVLQRALRT